MTAVTDLAEGPPELQDYVFFKSLGDYGQVVIPSAIRKKLEFDGEEIYAMVIIIPVVTKNSAMTREEAYEYLRHLVSQSERTPKSEGV